MLTTINLVPLNGNVNRIIQYANASDSEAALVIHVSKLDGLEQSGQLDSSLSSFVDTNKKIIIHIHPRLNATLDGRPVIVPTGIGINSSLWNDNSLDEYGMQPMKMEMGGSSMIMQGMAPLHTHDTSGVIHVESNQVRSYTLGQFLQNWGIDLQDKTVKLIVDGKTIQDYEGHKLTDKEHMILILENQKT